jgi:hypothetical protein
MIDYTTHVSAVQPPPDVFMKLQKDLKVVQFIVTLLILKEPNHILQFMFETLEYSKL